MVSFLTEPHLLVSFFNFIDLICLESIKGLNRTNLGPYFSQVSGAKLSKMNLTNITCSDNCAKNF